MASMAQTLLFPHTLFLTSSPKSTHLSLKPKTHKPSSTKKVSDAELASDLASQAEKIRTQMAQREEAMEKSRELLFGDLCHHLALGEDQVMADWGKMEEDEKWVLVRGFVAVWSARFHLLSVTSVKEMVESYFLQHRPKTTPSASSSFFSSAGFNRFLGFSPSPPLE